MGVSRKQSTPNFPKNEHFLPPVKHRHVCVSRGKKCSVVGKFGVLNFLETPVWRFSLLPYYRQINYKVTENVTHDQKSINIRCFSSMFYSYHSSF